MSVRFNDVTFSYPDGSSILDHFHLDVAPGEIVAIVGRSGAGKTTILKLVNRLLLPTSGSVTVEERDTRDWDPIALRRRTGYVFQEIGLFPHLSVAENVGLVPRLESWAGARAAERVMELLEMVGLPAAEYGERAPQQLSGGQRQRVGLARALAANPGVLLMDEPFGALDPITRAEVRGAFATLQARLGISTVIVTHDMGEAFSLGQRVAVLDRGRMVVCDRPEVVAASADLRVRAFLDALPPVPGSR